MRKPLQSAALVIVTLSAAARLHAATFVVPPDREMVRRADVIVIASALTSYTQLTPQGGIETVTPISIEEVISGGNLPDVINVVEPGGVHGDRVSLVAGSPQFAPAERHLLLLRRTGADRWAVADLVLGKFTFASDIAGHKLLVRDEDEIAGWDPDLNIHTEKRRAADRFLRFVREESHGIPSAEDYIVPGQALRLRPRPMAGGVAAAAAFSKTSYSMTVSGSMGSRWNVFPSTVTFFRNASGEPGAPGSGSTAVSSGAATWTNDAGSNVNYVFGGTDSTHNNGLSGPDGANTVLFERNLSSYGISPFTCSGSSYGGTVGIGGITAASGSNSVGGETFVTTTEGDVEMNQGIANCSALFNNGDFNSAVAHELGHTLGFRHSDQNRSSSGACSGDPSLECSSQAIMRSSIPGGLNAALQAWDVNAVRAIYPGSSPPPPTCTAPSITGQPQSRTIPPGTSTTLTVTPTGTAPLLYQWYNGTSGNTSSPIAGAAGPSVTVSSAGNYWVRVTNSCGSANSATATVTLTAPPPSGRYKHGDYGDSRTDVTVYRPSNGMWFILGVATIQWGSTGDIPVPSDYDGDRKADVAVYRPSTGVWFLRYSSTGGGASIQFGSPGDIPVPGDYDNDGRYDVAVYRPSTGVWFVRFSATGAGSSTQLGSSGDRPVPADYNGDGRTDFAVYRPSNGTWFILGVATVQWGSPGDVPVPSDYDGDGKADVAVYRPSNGFWFYIRSSNGAGVQTQFGSPGDTPMPGDYDGDGRADIAVYRPSIGVWFFTYSSTGSGASIQFGSPGDIPQNQ